MAAMAVLSRSFPRTLAPADYAGRPCHARLVRKLFMDEAALRL